MFRRLQLWFTDKKTSNRGKIPIKVSVARRYIDFIQQFYGIRVYSLDGTESAIVLSVFYPKDALDKDSLLSESLVIRRLIFLIF